MDCSIGQVSQARRSWSYFTKQVSFDIESEILSFTGLLPSAEVVDIFVSSGCAPIFVDHKVPGVSYCQE